VCLCRCADYSLINNIYEDIYIRYTTGTIVLFITIYKEKFGNRSALGTRSCFIPGFVNDFNGLQGCADPVLGRHTNR
jgi:hypothetical protein